MEYIRELAIPLARHEMGHYVTATVMGFKTGQVQIELLKFNGRKGGSVIHLGHGHRSLAGLEKYLIARVQVLYAGALAEALPLYPDFKVDNEKALKVIHGEGGKDDHSKARELIHVLRGIRHPEDDLSDENAVQNQLTEIDEELWKLARDNVERHSEAIVGLASNLADRVKALAQVATITEGEFASYSRVQELRELGRLALER